MLRGFYAAGTGILGQSRAIDIAANNMANAETAGYKKDGVAMQSFGDYLVSLSSTAEGSASIGRISHGAVAGTVYTAYDQGALEQTGQSGDLAILGEGFFTVRLPDDTTAMTRNGHFLVNADGYLTDTAGNLLLGQNGPIQTEGADFTVGADGEITVGDSTAGTLLISCPADASALVKIAEGLYADTGNQTSGTFSGQIVQGALEKSNVDVASEMMDLMAASRSFQSCSQILKMMDQTLAKTVGELGKV
jgi:flagellar basal-body rod protein FlgG